MHNYKPSAIDIIIIISLIHAGIGDDFKLNADCISDNSESLVVDVEVVGSFESFLLYIGYICQDNLGNMVCSVVDGIYTILSIVLS